MSVDSGRLAARAISAAKRAISAAFPFRPRVGEEDVVGGGRGDIEPAVEALGERRPQIGQGQQAGDIVVAAQAGDAFARLNLRRARLEFYPHRCLDIMFSRRHRSRRVKFERVEVSLVERGDRRRLVADGVYP